jgi:glycosyltransferase involved in cell wall biosynthesis
MDRTAVIVPSYNEERSIAGTILLVREVCPASDIVVIDDGSTDLTARVSRTLGVHVISLPFNLGYAAALHTGFKYAYAKRYDCIALIDADGQHDPHCIPRLLELLKADSADFILGSRFLGEHTYPIEWTKRVGMALFRLIGSKIVGHPITDTTSGFIGLNKRIVAFFATNPYPSDYSDINIIIEAFRAGFRILEAPVTMHAGPAGTGMYKGVTPIYYTYKMLLSILVTFLRKRPTRGAAL